MNVLQKGVDPITKGKLKKNANLHHRVLTSDEEDYRDFSNKDNFVLLNLYTHKFLHWLFPYWEKDKNTLNRIGEELEKWERK